jgi:5-methylcytosine-specific restriction enzyme subunit McrC
MIPIQNLYYLLCYAWNRLDEADLVSIGRDDLQTPQDLFARVLVTGTNRLLKKGLDRGYLEHVEETASLRGKIDFSSSISKLLFEQAKAIVIFDELSHNILHNQILKTTIFNLSKVEGIHRDLRHDLRKLNLQLGDIDLIKLTSGCFKRVQLHKNNAFYSFLISICELIHQYLVPDPSGGEHKMRDFTRDERKMQNVFQDFARNFYKLHQQEFKVTSQQLDWGATGDEESLNRLPNMYTDVTLESSQRKIILDTKYYKEAFQVRFDKSTFRSENLYQLNAYLDSSRVLEGQKLDGVLLYPATIKEFTYDFSIRGFNIKIAAVDLRKSPQEIHQRMLEIIF